MQVCAVRSAPALTMHPSLARANAVRSPPVPPRHDTALPSEGLPEPL